jgi:hypothetical protein
MHALEHERYATQGIVQPPVGGQSQPSAKAGAPYSEPYRYQIRRKKLIIK